MDRFPPLSELIATVLRHITLISAIILLGVLASVFYALSLPRIYQTAAVVQIEQSAVPDPTTGAGPTNGPTLQRLQVIEQRLMARDNLISIIDRLDLAEGDVADADDVLALRLATDIVQITDPDLRWRSDVAPTALLIEVRDGDAERAALIANAFVADISAQSRTIRSERVSGTLAFFASEEARIAGAITELDDQIAVFKLENAQSLPDAVLSQREQLLTLEENELELEGEIIEASASTRIDTARIARLEEQLSLIVSRRAAIEAALARAPDVERQFNSLERELGQLTAQYAIVARSRAEAEMGQMLDTSAAADSFVVLERAVVPDHPIAPNRRRIVALGGVASVLVAFGLVMLLEHRNPVLRTAAQMERRLGLRPVVSIPNIEVRSERLSRQALWISLGGLVILMGIVAVQLVLGQG